MPKIYRFDTFQYVDVLQKEINYFLSLAEHLNISKASESLGIQQSGLSRALQRLESDLGQKLFQRKNNGLQLTSAGDQFYRSVKNTKVFWEENFRKLVEGSENPTGLYKLGFHPSFGQKYFPQIVKDLSQSFPQIEIEVHTLASSAVTRKVNDQELDLGIVITKIKYPEIVQKKVGNDFIAAFQRDPSKAPQKILFNPDMQLSAPILRKYAETKKVVIKDYEIMASTCLSTDCLALLPNSVAGKYTDLQQVGGAFLKAEISCIIHKEKMRSHAHRKVFEAVVKSCLR